MVIMCETGVQVLACAGSAVHLLCIFMYRQWHSSLLITYLIFFTVCSCFKLPGSVVVIEGLVKLLPTHPGMSWENPEIKLHGPLSLLLAHISQVFIALTL